MDKVFTQRRQDLLDLAAQLGLTVDFVAPHSQEEFMAHFKTKDVLILINSLHNAHDMGGYTPEMIAEIARSGVRAVGHQGAGYDSVGDVEVWRANGVAVANTPISPAPETANTAMFLLIGALRHFPLYERTIARGVWRTGVPRDAPSPPNMVLGILGMGRIGSMVRDRALPFNFKKILYHQRRQVEDSEGAEFVADLDDFLAQCDALVICMPLSKATYHILDRQRLFNSVKKDAVIVNVARGAIIDEDALVDALNSGHISFVGLDVFETDPIVHPGLMAAERALLLPHAGALTTEVFRGFEGELMDFIKMYVEKGVVLNQVN